jgi:LysM repeat protein
MEKRTRRSPARFLAPLALIGVLIAFLMIVNGSSTNSSSPSEDSTTTPTATTTSTKTKSSTSTTRTAVKKTTSGSRTYTVQVGDTLGGIADKTGVPLERIETLNPNVDPHAMVTGQKIRLK